MSRGTKALSVIGTLGAVVGLISLGVSLVIVAAVYVVGLDTFDLPAIGPLIYGIPFALAAGGIGLWLLTKLLRWAISDHEEPEKGAAATPTSEPTGGPSSALHSFSRANFYLAVIFGLLFVVGSQQSVIGNALAGTPLAVIAGFLFFAVQMLGGTGVQLLNLVVFGAAWYGISRYEATEAWLLGMVGWGLLTASGVALLTNSLGAIAIVIGGLRVLLTGYRAQDATQPFVLDDYVSELTQVTAANAGTSRADDGPVDAANGGPITTVTREVRERDLRDPAEVKDLVDVDPAFVHPRAADADRLTYWSYLSYALGGLTVLSALLVGIDLWGFPDLGVIGLLIGALYLAHGFGLPQGSAFIHVGGLVLYGFMLLLALVTVSPLVLVGTAGGLYLGWTATPGIAQPDEVLEAVSSGSGVTGLVGGGLVGAGVLGVGLGLLGAIIFAAVSVQTRTVYGLLLLLPAVAGGLGVGLGVGEEGGRLTGGIGAVAGLVGVLLGFRLLSWWMPTGYELQGDPLLLVVPLLGLVIAYRLGRGVKADEAAPAD